jgi:protein-tyrosine phosphatase
MLVSNPFTLYMQHESLWNSIFDVMKILMVCLGNICRSPLAEGILQHKIVQNSLDWVVDSAGTAGYHIGEAPHVLSQKVALQHGVDISTQRCRQFVQQDIIRFDRIYVMDRDNYTNVKRICGNLWNVEKVSLLLDMLYPGENQEVPDPWYGTEKDYHFVYDLVNRACDKIIDTYK